MSVKRFERLLKIRKMEENQAALVLAGRLGELTLAEEQLTQLTLYLNDYLGRTVPGDVQQLKRLGALRTQLRGAIEQQGTHIDAAQGRVEQAQTAWLERHQASLSLMKLIDRRRRAELALENRRQQHELDAWATRYAFSRLEQGEIGADFD